MVLTAAASVCGPAAYGAGADSGNKYSEAVTGEKGLLGYWLLDKDLQAKTGRLKLSPSKPVLSTTAGPFEDSCINLSDGNALVMAPCAELDAPRLSIEILFKVVNTTVDNPCLFAIRNTEDTRFSLHYISGSTTLLLWNGSASTVVQCHGVLTENEWFHLALSFDKDRVQIWLNGRECKLTGRKGPVAAAEGLPLVIGSSAPSRRGEHADIAVARLALYDRTLSAGQVVQHMKAAGWARKIQETPMWQDCPVSILETQIGYHPLNVKRVYLRSAQENPPAEFLASEFVVMDAESRKEVFRGKVEKWGKQWETFWWILDFTPLRLQGEYCVQAGKLMSSPFKIEDGIFRKTGLGIVALDQLENRIHGGPGDKRRGMPGKYVNCSPDVRIYMDCGSPYAELEPVGTCAYALFDLYDLLGDKFTEADRKRMLALAAMGADYLVAAQRHTDDPETDGMFYHSLLVHSEADWAGSFSTYLDTAYGVALLARAYQFFEKKDPVRAARYLAASKKAWELCARRPYHTNGDRTLPPGANAFFWNAPAGIQDTFGRCLYNILDEKWTLPFSLRTRDRLPFVKGSALLHEITGERKYFDKAVEFADAIMERQFTDWENPIDGCFGTFYEFQGDNQSFFHEFMQGGFWWEGNVEAMNLDGFMHLLKLAPTHPRAAAWLNTIKTYADNYARNATTRNPLGIYPVACYRDPQHGGLKYFQNTLMGSSCLHGFSAKNFLELGGFLMNPAFQCNAMAGVNFIAGLNPGVPNAYKETAWDARTLIMGVGRSWFGPAGEPTETAKGSVPNGFCASPQFWQTPASEFINFLSYQPDRPVGLIGPGNGLQFNEGWILHSHAYVQAVARLEARYTLRLKTTDKGAGVPAAVVVSLRETAAPHSEHTGKYQTGSDGTLTVADLPTPCEGTVRFTRNGREINRPVAAISGSSHTVAVDFACDVSLSIRVPENMPAGGQGEAVLSVDNTGSGNVDLKLALSAAGVTLEKTALEVALKHGEKKSIAIAFKCGERVTPYLVRAVIVDGAPARDFYATGKISSADRPRRDGKKKR